MRWKRLWKLYELRWIAMPPSDPLEDLIAARQAFMGQTEAEECVRLTDGILRRGAVDWLEIGAGDGANLSFQLAYLASGRDIRAVALEPSSAQGAVPGVLWLRAGAEHYRPDTLFDWISVRHSAYYIPDPVTEIARLAGALSPVGAIALTHWSNDCVLRRLHLALCGDLAECATAGIQQLASALTRDHSLIASSLTVFDSELDVNRVLADALLAEALARLASRGRPLAGDRSELPRRVADALIGAPSTSRRNGIVFLRRAY
jgi:hypothetical protein